MESMKLKIATCYSWKNK